MTETPEQPQDRGETTPRHGDPVLDADAGAQDTQVDSVPVDADQEDAELTD
ncbi:MAG: hypothetical protein QOI54_2570 [Actinomycetota bacterium]|jgi:hypothetical protein|nr:hypothetical protein [Actinomycetota bacterium]